MKSVLNICVYFILTWIAAGKSITTNFATRIAGGENVTIEEFPYQVSVEYRGRNLCGGSLIGDTVILTVAHCVSTASPEIIKVRAGTDKREKGGVVVKVKEIHLHENFSRSGVDMSYDAALLELSEPLSLSDKINTIELVEENESLEVGTKGIVAGFGRTKAGGRYPSSLMKAELSTVDRKECRDKYNENELPVTDTMFCTSTAEGKDACQGDDGGAFVVDNKQFGIISWGWGCAREGYYEVYTSIPAVREWINSKVNI